MTTLSHLRMWVRTAALSALLAVAMASPKATAQEVVSFQQDVFPIIELRCLECHQPGGSGYEASGLDLRTYEGLMNGTKHGSIVTPGNAFESNLIAVIDQRTDPTIWMPHNRKPLSKCERLLLRFWVSQGAKNN
ncbi:MAG TPA: c-type cytochrome domain-containing protein [Kiloniellales bacterium]